VDRLRRAVVSRRVLHLKERLRAGLHLVHAQLELQGLDILEVPGNQILIVVVVQLCAGLGKVPAQRSAARGPRDIRRARINEPAVAAFASFGAERVPHIVRGGRR
jgi:hypothetical protein